MKKYFLMGLFFFSLVSCQREIDKYYEIPDWLKGNAYEVMEDRGNFSIFMKAVDRSSYASLVKGKGIVTVMAPTDDAFSAYLTKHNYGSVEDISQTELDKLIGYHLIYYSYTKQNFMFYNPNGIDAELENPGTYFKFRTKSRDAISTVKDYANGGVIRKIMHKDRFIPVISNYSLSGWSSSPKDEYEKMFPGSTYGGGTNNFNISNAGIVGDEIVTDNGYLYVVDQVLEPLETLYTEMSHEGSEYTKFAAMYDRFVKYEYDEDATADYGNGDSLFVHSHYSLPSIACEWTNLSEYSIPDYAQLNYLSSISFTVLAPDNAAIDEFYRKYWANSFSSLEEVNYVPLYYFMSAHAGEYRDKMMTSTALSAIINMEDRYDGTTITEPDYVKVCTNGILGGMKGNVITPEPFESPMAPALCNKDYNIFALIAHRGGLISKIQSINETQFNIFFPSDDMLKRTEYNGDFIQYLKGNPYIINDEQIQVANAEDGTLGNLNTTQAQEIAGAHVMDNVLSTRNGGTEIIYSSYNDFEYLYRVNDEIYSSATWNSKALGNEVSVPTAKLIKDYGEFGASYALEGDNTTVALLPEQANFKDRVMQDKNMNDYKGINVYLNASNVGKGDNAFSFIQGNRFIIFIPTNEAVMADMTTGPKRFPVTGSMDQRNMYVTSLFIDVSSSGLVDYPFPVTGKRTEKVLTTFGTKTVNGKKESITVTLINEADGSMKLRDAKGNEVNVTSYFPYIYADGAAYVIDGVLDLLN